MFGKKLNMFLCSFLDSVTSFPVGFQKVNVATYWYVHGALSFVVARVAKHEKKELYDTIYLALVEREREREIGRTT